MQFLLLAAQQPNVLTLSPPLLTLRFELESERSEVTDTATKAGQFKKRSDRLPRQCEASFADPLVLNIGSLTRPCTCVVMETQTVTK